MRRKSEWDKIIVARVIEGLLTAFAFGVGIWHTVKSKKLEDELDSQFEDDETDEDE